MASKMPRDEAPAAEPTAEDLLYLDIDARIGVDGWVHVWAMEESGTGEELAAVVRLAYGRGYLDALRELRRGQLCRDHGFAVPIRGPQR